MSDTSNTSNTGEQVEHTIADWVGDIVALESHVEEALDRQLQLKSGDTTLTAAVQRFHDTVRDSKRRAEQYQQQVGSTGGNPIIKVGASLLGKAAGIIDKMRADSISKALRDDYTAFNHLAIAYTMLHTTSMALEDQATQDFAAEGLRTYATMVQQINHLIPEAVVYELSSEGHAPVQTTNVVEACRQQVEEIWRSTAQSA